MVIAVATPILNKVFALNMGTEELQLVIGPLVAYIMGQGIADVGKHKQ